MKLALQQIYGICRLEVSVDWGYQSEQGAKTFSLHTNYWQVYIFKVEINGFWEVPGVLTVKVSCSEPLNIKKVVSIKTCGRNEQIKFVAWRFCFRCCQHWMKHPLLRFIQRDLSCSKLFRCSIGPTTSPQDNSSKLSLSLIPQTGARKWHLQPRNLANICSVPPLKLAQLTGLPPCSCRELFPLQFLACILEDLFRLNSWKIHFEDFLW